jgi:catechol 2,3-dioxygenase-like lactoylglutathione lyase family enzyme
MGLGAFSVSLAVKDIHASKDFYGKLGFEDFGGDITQNWLIMKSGDTIIGLFQGMFDKNMLTFNPGWDQDAKPVEGFTDIRVIQEGLVRKGVALATKVAENTQGPGSFTVSDPDGNNILFDQFV